MSGVGAACGAKLTEIKLALNLFLVFAGIVIYAIAGHALEPSKEF